MVEQHNGKSRLSRARVRRQQEASAVQTSLADDDAPCLGFHPVQLQVDGRTDSAPVRAVSARRMHRAPGPASTVPTDDARRGHRTRRRTSARTAATPRRRMQVPAIVGVSGRMPAPPPRRAVQTAVQARAPERSPNRAGSLPDAPAIPAVRSRLRQLSRRRRRPPPSLHRRTPPHAPAPGVSGRVRLCQLDTDAVRHQDIEHAPQQVRAAQPRDRIEHDNHSAARIKGITKRIESTRNKFCTKHGSLHRCCQMTFTMRVQHSVSSCKLNFIHNDSAYQV